MIRWAEAKLAGWPDEALSGALIGVAVLLIVIALWGRPIMKPTALAWVVLP